MEIHDVTDAGEITWVEILWPSGQSEWSVKFAFGFVGGRIRCVGMSVLAITGASAFSAARLREIPSARMIEEILAFPPRELVKRAKLPPFNSMGQLQEVGLSRLRVGSKIYCGRGRPTEYGEDHYREVARVYRSSLSKPTQAVAEAFDVKRTTAANWVRTARQLGLLPQQSSMTEGGA